MVQSVTNDRTRTADAGRALEQQTTQVERAKETEVERAALRTETERVSDAAAERVADRVAGTPDDFTRSITDPKQVQATGEITPEVDKLYTDLTEKMQSGDWAKSPEAAASRAQEIRDAAAKVPERYRKDFIADVTRPVQQMAQQGLRDPSTGRIDPQRLETIGKFSDLLDQQSVQAMGTTLRQAENDPAGQRAIASTLHDVASKNQDSAVRTSAARTLLAGPADVVRDGLSGKVDGMDARSLAQLSDEHGTLASDQRLLALSQGLDPSVQKTLQDEGIHEIDMSTDSEALHTALDVAGMAPGGVAADVANALLYGLEGRVGDALWSAGAAIPAAGQVIGGMKLARRGKKLVDEATGKVVQGAALLGRKTGAELGLAYKTSDKHRDSYKIGGYVAPPPKNGQAALDGSVVIKADNADAPRRIGVDQRNREIVIFDRTAGSEYHAHVRTWDQLTPQMRDLMMKMQYFDKRGRWIDP